MTSVDNSETTTRRGGGFVLYPREYRIDEANPQASSVIGVTRGGEVRQVYLQPPEGAVNAAAQNNAKTVPSLARFAQTGRRARTPCEASPENGPQRPFGVLLIEQAFAIDPAEGVWGGRWASVLRNSTEDPLPALGIGYLEINVAERLSEQGSALMEEFRALEEARAAPGANLVDIDERQVALRAGIYAAQKKWFTSVLLRPKESVILAEAAPAALAAALRGPLEHYTRRGMYGGALVRLRDGDRVILSACAQIEMQFDFTRRETRSFDEVFSTFMRYQGGRLLSECRRRPGSVIEVVPALRINCGPNGNELYGRQLEYWQGGTPKIIKTFVDRTLHDKPLPSFRREQRFLAAQVAVRIAEIQDGPSQGNLITASLHAFSPILGHAQCIAPDGRALYRADDGAKGQGESRKAG
jgi:hypothetical protein